MLKSVVKNIPETEPYSLLNEEDIRLFSTGKHFRIYEKLGSHIIKDKGGVYFAVWAPNAEKVSVIGNFNHWNHEKNPLFPRWDSSGIWEGFIPGLTQGELYKYSIKSRATCETLEKTDPFAFMWETPPKTGSVVWDLTYERKENNWKQLRETINRADKPISIYEVHFGSWLKEHNEGSRSISYLEAVKKLPEYVKKMGFTHVQFLPIMEHPFEGSWGYQTLGYFAPTGRYGTPQDFMSLIDAFHELEIGVILDWVPSHFPEDAHGLAKFDGTFLFEHADPKKGFHPDWKSAIFNYGRNEVVSFLISSALFWFDQYRIDALRVDAVASMLYLDYSRKAGEWIPNEYGGNENIEAIHFLRELNAAVYREYPYAQTIAEESTAWPMVSRPVYLGGLGFGMKWNMGWMHDVLVYFSKDPIYRKHHQGDLSFSMIYAYNENFVLPLSHDEVVHGKAALLSKMPGDDWQKFANLRLLYGYMFLHPGKKLLFMGAELAMWDEWNHQAGIPWHFLDYDRHHQIRLWVHDLNNFYKTHSALYETDFIPEGFKWIDLEDRDQCVVSFIRYNKAGDRCVVAVMNLTPMPRENYKVGVPVKGDWQEVLNSDSQYYGGGNLGNFGKVSTIPIMMHGYLQSLNILLPPLAIVCFEQKI